MRIPACVIADELASSGYDVSRYCDDRSDFRQKELANDATALPCMEAALAYQDWFARMLELSSGHASIDDLAALLAERLPNPVAVFAADGSVLACSGEFAGDIGGTIWERLEKGTLDWGFYARGDQEWLTRQAMRATAPVRFRPSVDPEHEYLSAFVRVRGQVIASLGMVDVNVPITTGQEEVVAAACRLLGTFFENNDLYFRLSKGAASVVGEALSGATVPREAMAHWLVEHGLPPDGPLRLFVALNPHAGEDGFEQAPFMRELGELLYEATLVLHDGSVAVMMADGCETWERVASAAERVGVCCGSSPVVRDPSELSTHFAQALLAARTAVEKGRVALRFEECVMAGVGALLRSGDVPWLWCDPSVRRLWERDEGGRELVRCLWQFLLHGRNVAAASRALYVHRNTLIYRLGRIERELDVSLDALDESEALLLLVSCLAVIEEQPQA